MVGRDDGFVVIWPSFFDAKLSRAAGRRVASHLAVAKPDVAWVASAAKKAGFKPTVEEDARHPSKTWEKQGRILITTEDKEAALKAIAKAMQ